MREKRDEKMNRFNLDTFSYQAIFGLTTALCVILQISEIFSVKRGCYPAGFFSTAV